HFIIPECFSGPAHWSGIYSVQFNIDRLQKMSSGMPGQQTLRAHVVYLQSTPRSQSTALLYRG
ncbi:hypothetical protein, partial [Vibrio breoganii]|uniref:hypothetical protein n=1 Tax=Vibrio breoganii TaxID=553239 RepID=UPI001A7E078C